MLAVIKKMIQKMRESKLKNKCLVCAVRTNLQSNDVRIMLIRTLLAECGWNAIETLKEMDSIIQDFCIKMRYFYKNIAQSFGFSLYYKLLRGYIIKKYPWINQSTYSVLYGCLSYR